MCAIQRGSERPRLVLCQGAALRDRRAELARPRDRQSGEVEVGGVVSTIVIASLGFQLGTGKTVILSLVVGTTSILLMAQIPWIPFTILMFLIMGFAQTQFRVGNSTLVQSLVPDELRGRVTSVYQFDNGFTPVAVLITSSMVQWTDIVTTMTIISSISLCFSISLLFFAKLVKQLE